MTAETIKFTSRADELIVARDSAVPFYKATNVQKSLMVPLGIILTLIDLAIAITHFIGHQDTVSHIIGAEFLIGALVTVPIILYRKRFLANQAKGGIAYEFRLGDRGIEEVVPKSFSIAWEQLTSVRDLGSTFVFVRQTGEPIVIPKRAFGDDGASLWAFLERGLVESRYLVCGSGAPPMITNSPRRHPAIFRT